MKAAVRLGREWRDLVAFLRSRAVILASILFLTVLYGSGLVVPQRARLAPRAYDAWRASRPRLVGLLELAGLTDVFRSPLVYVATGLFFATLLAVISDRVPRLVRRSRLDHGLPLEAGFLARRKGTRRLAVTDPREALQRAAGVLESRGYRAFEATSGALRAVRFRWAPLGFLFFHGSFALLLAGAISLDLTRFSVLAKVGEGESFDAATGPFQQPPRTPRVGARHPEVAFRVMRVRPVLEDGKPKRLGADLLFAGETSARRVEVSNPVVLGSKSVLITAAGPAPLFTCSGPEGASGGAWVKLNWGGDRATRFELPECGLEVLARATEDRGAGRAAERGVMLQSTGSAAGREALESGAEVALRVPGGAVTRGVILPGGELSTDDGERRLAMPDVRLYGSFKVVDERGGALLWAGFILGVLGLVSRLVLFRREVVVVAVDRRSMLLAAAADGAGLGRQELLLARLERLVAESHPGPEE